MLNFNSSHKSGSSGFTVIELLISLMITSVIGLVVIRVMSSASNVLATTADSGIAAQQAVRLANVFNYDLAGATSLEVFNYSTGSADVSNAGCVRNNGPKTYVESSGGVSYQRVRNIATVTVTTLTPTGDNLETSFGTRNKTFVSYQIRLKSTGDPYELWRINCGSTQGNNAPTGEKIATLGYMSTSLVSGSEVFRCSGLIPVSGSLINVDDPRYTFSVPSSTIFTAGSSWKLYDANRYTNQIVGTIPSPTPSSTSVRLSASPTPSPQATGTNWIFTQDCEPDINVLASSKLVIFQLPYSGQRDSLDAQAPIVLTSRLGR